jgi:hypothetical protein
MHDYNVGEWPWGLSHTPNWVKIHGRYSHPLKKFNIAGIGHGLPKIAVWIHYYNFYKYIMKKIYV